MKEIILITHAQAQHHLQDVVGGWHDSSLSPLGIAHASVIAKKLKEDFKLINPSIFSSDLKRASETAAPIAQLWNTSVTELRGLRELSYGEAEGKSQAWLDARFSPPPIRGNRMDHRVCAGAESRRDLAKRIYSTMDEIYRNLETSSVVVSHGFAHTFIVSWWIGLPIENADYVHFAAKSGSVTHLQEDDTFHNRSVERLNDTTHLA